MTMLNGVKMILQRLKDRYADCSSSDPPGYLDETSLKIRKKWNDEVSSWPMMLSMYIQTNKHSMDHAALITGLNNIIKMGGIKYKKPKKKSDAATLADCTSTITLV